jgi:diadenosine tetraphosphate (Ap4A) HIT family hydrolase
MTALVDDCLACDILAGRVTLPGGVLFEDAYWWVDHRASPVLLPGFLIVKPRRHVEHLADLTDAEGAGLGPVLRLASRALTRAVAPAKVYAASFGERVRHLHCFVLPRTPDMPAHGLDVLNALFRERRWACSDAEAVAVAERIRAELREAVV